MYGGCPDGYNPDASKWVMFIPILIIIGFIVYVCLTDPKNLEPKKCANIFWLHKEEECGD